MAFIEATDLTEEDIFEVNRKMQRGILNYMVRHNYIGSGDAEDMISWQHFGGFSVDASVRIEAWDRNGLEQLIRYCARPPFALDRLGLYNENTVVYRLKNPDPYGQTDLLFITNNGPITPKICE